MMKWFEICLAIGLAIATSAPLSAQQAPAAGKANPHVFQPPAAVKEAQPSPEPEGDPLIPIETNEHFDQRPVGQAPASFSQRPEEVRHWTSIEIVLSFSILVFGAMVFALQTWLIVRMPLNWTPNAILRFNGLTLIITGAILLVTAGYSNEQMTPVIGLLGAIAGYLLGSVEKPEEKRPGGPAAVSERDRVLNEQPAK
jgi:hypothetical protein